MKIMKDVKNMKGRRERRWAAKPPRPSAAWADVEERADEWHRHS
jgi:hypothetical protein